MFDWDDAKARANRKKHGVTFEEAITAFDDPRALIEHDDRHDEDRFRLIGLSDVGVLVVVFVEREKDTTRIVSARHAMRKEKEAYERQAIQF